MIRARSSIDRPGAFSVTPTYLFAPSDGYFSSVEASPFEASPYSQQPTSIVYRVPGMAFWLAPSGFMQIVAADPYLEPCSVISSSVWKSNE